MWPVWANQNRDRPVKTRPLSGISDGSTTSNADSRSDATSSNRSSLTAKRSRTLPLRRNVSAGALAGDMDLGLQAIESGEDGGHVAQECGVVEAGVEVGHLEVAGHGRVECEQLPQRPPLVGRPERGPLDDRVGLLARQSGPLDEDDENAAARVETEAAFDVLAHPLASDDQSLDEGRALHEHVVEKDRGVGQDHPLGGAVADVPLVPQRLVLERSAGIAAEEPRQTRDPFRQDRVALVGHRRAALLTGLERLLELADLGVLEVPDLRREALEAAAQDRHRAEERGMPVALDDLCARGVGVEPELAENLRLQIGPEVAVRPDRSGDLAGPDLVDRPGEAAAAPVDLERPAGELQPERDRLGVDRVGPAHHHGFPSARARAISTASSRSQSRRSSSPAARSWSARPVSTTSLLVSPKWRYRPSGPTVSATWLTNAMTS